MHSKNAPNSTPPKFNIEPENDGFQKESPGDAFSGSMLIFGNVSHLIRTTPQKKRHEPLYHPFFSMFFHHIGLMMLDGSITPNTGSLHEKEPCSNVHYFKRNAGPNYGQHFSLIFDKTPSKMGPQKTINEKKKWHSFYIPSTHLKNMI